MRQFKIYNKQEKEITKIICNQCGKEIEVVNGIAKEEVLTVEKQWGYFSDKDTEFHQFDMCEQCYDKLISSFRIPVEIRPE
ncbi:hypothetical protein NE683_19890 [Bariatricus massiliensis]|uniref:Ribosomal-protein-alanine N-acetyltransferase n=1 Tax=Bariatricus massiliensis TaxID=1745713 RepID=A0ABS8DMF5_9FIRM|nr:hypothetical protein [Bariatricus massiliensis]MCB7306354.1 hypothetical protein [Bariatricus massiliensis]MCB7376862.1 hypothetical protein [Bariatricus massiliensis]MCB7389547.1 hypothetical protein [Bariatricus massiliensis]MCB7413704.1 hypothetical protein [Bariatricus massiliensis]MCQ5255483.1 hypothetical protein [Bariatricus massiliensis]